MRRVKLAISLLLVFWSLTLVLWPAPTETDSPSQKSSGHGEGLYRAASTQANFGLVGVRFYETDTNRKRWNIRSHFAELHRKDNYAFLEQVDADFYAEKTGNLVVTESDYGRCYLEKDEVELEGEVSIRSKRGYLFEMDRLKYLGKTHSFTSEDVVLMRGPDADKPAMHLKGTGLFAEIDREYFVLRKQVQAQRRLKNGEWLKIQSNTGEFHTEDQHARFRGNVRSQFPLANIESDEMEIQVVDERESIRAKGNVLLKTKKRRGKADSAFIEVGSSVIILEGRASIDANDNQIRGRRILLYSDEDRVEVEGAEGRITQ